jgi:hypothetical protein
MFQFRNGSLHAIDNKRSAHTSFTIVRVAGSGEIRSGDAVALRSLRIGMYASAADAGGGVIDVNRTAIHA